MGRHLKQLIYGAGYLAILTAFLFGVYSVFLKPSPSCTNVRQDVGEEGVDCGGVCPTACLPQNLKSLEVVGVIVRRPTPTAVTIVGKIQNPNGALAVQRVPYHFEFRDAEEQLVEELPTQDTFLYAGEVRYIPLFEREGIIPDGGVVNLILGEPEWVPANEFQEPDVVIIERNVELSEIGMTVVGRIVHRDTVRLPRVTIVALFYDPTGRSPLGASETTIDDLVPGETREFAIVHPIIPNYDSARLELIVVAEQP